MEELLQQLWNEYKLIINTLDTRLDATPEEFNKVIDKIITDTPEMVELRCRLREAGIVL